ncbi:MAG: S9 family peptidase, partial [Bacteroidetes bacterium]|nr:S9 family peptidase [Bacteroidota bacterium]
MKYFSFVSVALILLISCSKSPKVDQDFIYPKSDKGDVVDTLFGVVIADPYRWMENDTAQSTADWVKNQNEITLGFLKKIPYRDAIKKRLEELYNYERLTAPFKEGEYYYFYKNDG